jgi:hypothetical protein
VKNELTLISAKIRFFSPYRRALPENIAALGGTLPSSGAVTEGSIKVFPQNRLNDLGTIRRGFFRSIAKVRVKAMGSANTMMVAPSLKAEAEKVIAEYRAKFAVAFAELDMNYEAWLLEHAEAHPEAKDVIMARAYPRELAISRCRYDVRPFTIVVGDADIDEVLSSLAAELFEDVAQEAAKIRKNSAFSTAQRVGQRSLRPIKAILAKLQSYAFLAPVVSGAVRLVSDTLDALPRHGWIEDGPVSAHLTLLKALVSLVSEPDEFADGARLAHSGTSFLAILLPGQIVSAAALQSAPVPSAVPACPQIDLTQMLPPAVAGAVSNPVPPILATAGMSFLPPQPWESMDPDEAAIF